MTELCSPRAFAANVSMQAADIGSPLWWQRIVEVGAPLIEAISESSRVRVTFLWRDPQGSERQSDTCRVYIDINSITDHHSLNPQSLQRLAGTDVWHWQVVLPANWRGSYAFIPVSAAQLPPAFTARQSEQRLQQRAWWRGIMDLAIADPLNPLTPILNSWGELSALHLPHAPDQSLWSTIDTHPGSQFAPAAQVKKISWHSAQLDVQRRVWIYATDAETQTDRPLVLLLDGQHWAERMPIYSALQAATAKHVLPAAVYVLIDAIDGVRRDADLACSTAFWRAVQDELLPRVAAIAPFSHSPRDTIIAGQSLGGLAAMYAALNWPHRFGGVLSQSGSFWWPHVELLSAEPSDGESGKPRQRKPGSRGWLTEQLVDGKLPISQLRIYQEVGSREDVMIDVNDLLHAALQRAGHDIHYQIFEGGHDWLCWRGGLLDGLRWLLAR